MSVHWVIVVAVTLVCTCKLEARPYDEASNAPLKSVVSLKDITQQNKENLNKLWDTQIDSIRRQNHLNPDETLTIFKRPAGQKKYLFGYEGPIGARNSHIQMSNGEGKVIGKYSYKNANGKKVVVHYTSGDNGFKVLSNDLPEDTDDVKRAKAKFFKAFNERKALHKKQKEERRLNEELLNEGAPRASALTADESSYSNLITEGRVKEEQEEEGDEIQGEEGEGEEEEEGGDEEEEEEEEEGEGDEEEEEEEEGDVEEEEEEDEDEEEEEEEDEEDEEDEDEEEDDDDDEEDDDDDDEDSDEDADDDDSSSSSSSEEDSDEEDSDEDEDDDDDEDEDEDEEDEEDEDEDEEDEDEDEEDEDEDEEDEDEDEEDEDEESDEDDDEESDEDSSSSSSSSSEEDEEDSSSSSSSSSSEEEEEMNEDELRKKFDLDFGKRLYKVHTVFTG